MKKSYYHLSKVIIILTLSFLVFSAVAIFNTKENKEPVVFEAASEKAYWQDRLAKEHEAVVYKEFKDKYTSATFEVQHLAAHLFGEILYKKTGHEGIGICDQQFSFGCYHGFFSSAISTEGIGVTTKLNEACIKQFGALPSACQHGLGHGLLEYLGTENLVEALQVCESIIPNQPLHGCKAGVFMQYNLPITVGSGISQLQKRPLKMSEPYEPCPNLAYEFRQACYYELTQLWDKFYDYDRIGQLCYDITDEEEKTACYKGVGNVAAPTTQFDVNETIALCKKMPEAAGQVHCLSQASWSFHGSENAKALAPLVCKSLSEKEKTNCVW